MSVAAPNYHVFDEVSILLRGAVSFFIGATLLVGGILMLTLDLPGWKLIIGLPTVQFGIVVLMYAFDEVTKKHSQFSDHQTVICPYCGFNNLTKQSQGKVHCGSCTKNIAIPIS